MRLRLGYLAAVPAAAVAAIVAPRAISAPPHQVVQQATLGSVQVSLVYTDTSKPYPNRYRGFGVSISRSGKVVLAQTIACNQCAPGGSALGKPTKSVRVVRLSPRAEPVVLVDLWTGGAHCCFRTEIYSWGGGQYRRLNQLWGDPGYALKDLGHDGALEFLTADDRFAYAFTDYADAVLPLAVDVLRGGQLVDVTGSFLPLVKLEAAKLWVGYLQAHRRRQPTRGILAAWVADESELGHATTAFATLELPQELADISRDPTAQVNATTFIAQLRGFLRKTGYTK